MFCVLLHHIKNTCAAELKLLPCSIAGDF